MNPFTITRTRYAITSTCDRCGEQGTRTTETALLRWQRAHRCTTDKEISHE